MSLFRRKKKEEPKPASGGNYWIENIGKLPIDDLAEHREDEAYLKNVLKNDKDVHRRSFSFALLSLLDKSGKEDAEFAANLALELDIDIEDFKLIISDYFDFLRAASSLKDLNDKL